MLANFINKLIFLSVRKFVAISILLALVALHIGIMPAGAFTGTTSVMGYITEINLGNMELTIDDEVVEISPRIEIKSAQNKKAYIHQLKVGAFVNANVIPYAGSWKASKIKLVAKNNIKSVTSFVTKYEDSVLTLANGQKFVVPKKPKLVGIDDFEKDTVIRVDGYISGNNFNIWRFVAPYSDKNKNYTFCGTLTNINENRLIIDTNLSMSFDKDFILMDEYGGEIPDSKPILGENLRVTCDVKSSILHVKKCELFDTITIQMRYDNNEILINNTPVNLDIPATQDDSGIHIPLTSIFDYCGLELEVKNNVMSTVYDGIYLEYNMKTGDIFEDSIHTGNIGIGNIKHKNSKYIVPLPVFGFLFSKDSYKEFGLLSTNGIIISNRY